MNILMDELPYTVDIAGQTIPINTDYRTGIYFEQCLADETLDDDTKLNEVLLLYFGESIGPLLTDWETVTEAVNAVMWFYRCGADNTQDDSESTGSGEEEPPFSYEHDSGYIYSAFVEAYHIDLTEKRLHWWQFRALFLALPEDVEFSKIIGYRTMEIPAKMPKEKKRFYQRMKKIHKLPDPPDRVRLEKDLEAILAKGGDISHLIK